MCEKILPCMLAGLAKTLRKKKQTNKACLSDATVSSKDRMGAMGKGHKQGIFVVQIWHELKNDFE